MPLILSQLESALESQWLGQYADSAADSAKRFAGAVSPWLAAGQAAGFPCTTASSRESQLAQLAEAAFQAKDPSLAGLLLAVAMLGYLAGQVFGPGAATAPTAFSAGVSAFQSVFADHQMPVSARAKTIAGGCQVMAMSTIVAFGVPPFAAPIV